MREALKLALQLIETELANQEDQLKYFEGISDIDKVNEYKADLVNAEWRLNSLLQLLYPN